MTRRPSGRASKACRPTWPGSASTRWWASPSRPCPPSRWTAGRFLFTNANTPYTYNTRCLNTLELYVDNIFVVNQQMTLDQAAQETVNPPWPTLKSLKLGGMVGGHLFCGIFWPPCFRWQQEQCWSISWKAVSTSGFSATVFMKIRFVYLYCCHTFCSHVPNKPFATDVYVVIVCWSWCFYLTYVPQEHLVTDAFVEDLLQLNPMPALVAFYFEKCVLTEEVHNFQFWTLQP